MLIAVAADDGEPAQWCFTALWPGDGAIGEAWRTF